MPLLKQILAWTKNLPEWQSDAVRRLFLTETTLSAQDLSELYILLKETEGLPNPDGIKAIPLAENHLPANNPGDQTVILEEMKNLKHVNCIASDQKLKFSKSGMTVIYGGNGSGKSGYARVMKQACRCRDQADTVYTNANDIAEKYATPEAKFKIDTNGASQVLKWTQGGEAEELLSTISVFDGRCARAYLTAEQDVAYLPYGLDVVENLANTVIPALQQKLSDEIEVIDTDTQAYVHLLGDTEVGKLIAGLSAKTDTKILNDLGTLSEVDNTRLAELKTALSETDPIAKSRELGRLASRLKTLAENISGALAWVSSDAITKLGKLDDDVVAAEDAESKAAIALQSGEALLPGTGEKAWQTLFEAARRYSTEIAYPEKEFPNTNDEDAVCVLCQTPLEEAGERMQRFEQYIKDDVAKTANQIRQTLKAAISKIDRANVTIPIDDELKEEIIALDPDIPDEVESFEKSIEEKRQWMIEAVKSHDWDNPPMLTENPRSKVRSVAAKIFREARTFYRAADQEKKAKLTAEYDELVARQNLEKVLKPVLELVERMKLVSTLEKCKRHLKTKPISDKSKELASEAVTKELKAALDDEFRCLNVGHIKTKLKEKNVKGKIFHQLLLELPVAHKVDEILSEGEQRAIAIGAFLAELSLANHSCGIVFDDPVSSLDHFRRLRVARRLVEEAQHRQVVVFTHDTSFLGQLRDEIENFELDHHVQFLEWKGKLAGNVVEGLPWGHSSYKERIDALEQMYNRIHKMPWPQYPNENEEAEMLRAYDRMRSAIERVVQDVVFNGVVRRYRDWIRIDNLTGVVGFTANECQEINRLYQRCNGIIDAHDPSSDKNDAVPSDTELKKDIDDLKAIVETVKDRRANQKNSKPAVA